MPDLSQAVGLTVTKPARVLFILDKPSEYAARYGQPRMDTGWSTLMRHIRAQGLSEADFEVTYAWPWVDDEGGRKRTDPILRTKKMQHAPDDVIWKGFRFKAGWGQALERLNLEIAESGAEILVPLGNLALVATTGRTSVAKWRGSMFLDGFHGKPVIPTYSGDAINRQWDVWPQVARDLLRVSRGLRQPIVGPEYDFIIRPNYSEALSVLNRLLQRAERSRSKFRISVDVETRDRQIACVGLAWSKTEALCIPYMCMEKADGYWTLEQEVNITYTLRALLTHPNVLTWGQNFLYDAQYFLRNFKYCPNHELDTMILQHTLYLSMPKGLDFLSSMYCAYHLYWKDESKNWDPALGEDQLWIYNCKDAVVTYEVAEQLQHLAIEKRLVPQAAFQQGMFWPVLSAMLRGVKINLSLREEFNRELFEKQEEISHWLREVLGQDINLASPQQLANLFYEDLGQPVIRKKGTFAVTTDNEALEEIGANEPLLYPITQAIAYLRSLSVLHKTFIVGAGLDEDQRMRCSYNVAGTITLRLSSSANAFDSGTNLQNVTTGDELGEHKLPNLRRMFVADRGKTLWDLDGDSADLRIVTWEANEPELKEMFAKGLKPYVEIAKEYYHDPSITKAHPSYPVFKAFAHATNYLGTPGGIAGRIGMPVRDVQRMQDWYFARFPRIKDWQERLKAQVSDKRWISNIYGYRLELYDRPSHNTINECAAWIPQSTVALWINHVWTRIYLELPWAEVLLQTHDSVTGQFDRHLGDWAVRELKRVAAQEVLPYADPLVIPAGIKTSDKSWGDCG